MDRWRAHRHRVNDVGIGEIPGDVRDIDPHAITTRGERWRADERPRRLREVALESVASS
jgi:hypothetical protein